MLLCEKAKLNHYEVYSKIIEEKISVDYIFEKLMEIETLKDKQDTVSTSPPPNTITVRSTSIPGTIKKQSNPLEQDEVGCHGRRKGKRT